MSQIPDAVDTVVCAPDYGWRYHPKHVEQFPDIINCVTLRLVGYIYWNNLTMHGPMNVKSLDVNLAYFIYSFTLAHKIEFRKAYSSE